MHPLSVTVVYQLGFMVIKWLIAVKAEVGLLTLTASASTCHSNCACAGASTCHSNCACVGANTCQQCSSKLQQLSASPARAP